jgi:hypothetical protein
MANCGGRAGNRTHEVRRSRAALIRETATLPTGTESRRPTQGVRFRPFPPVSGHSLGHNLGTCVGVSLMCDRGMR